MDNLPAGGTSGSAGPTLPVMPFRSGSASYARHRVIGGPAAVTAELLETLAEHVVRPASVGTPPEVQAGWTAGRHVFDQDFVPEVVVFGETLLIGMRVDVCRVPAELRRAYRALAEAARSAEEGPIPSRSARREAKEEADDRCREELAGGRHRKSKLVPVLWDLRSRLLLAPVFGDALLACLRDLMLESFDARVEPLTAGTLAAETLQAGGRGRDYEDLAPTPFTHPPANAEEERPVVPWSGGPSGAKDFLGNEFLAWVWRRTFRGAHAFPTSRGEVAIAIDRTLDLDCAYDAGGSIGVRGDAPAGAPEARAALRCGKWPRKTGLLVAARGETAELVLQGDRFLVTGLRLPRPEEPPTNERESVEQRLDAIGTIDEALVGLYRAFLEERCGGGWAAEREALAAFAAGRAEAPRREPVAAPEPPLVEVKAGVAPSPPRGAEPPVEAASAGTEPVAG